MRFSLLLLAGALALGCETEVNSDLGDELPRDTYPGGPYGTAVETILAPLEFVTPEGETFSLDADVFKNPDHRLLFVTTTAGWCTACIEEQPKLNELHRDFGDKGLVVLVSYFQDTEFNAATPEGAAQWKARFGLLPTVVADPPFVLKAYYDQSLTPMSMLVNVSTMEILYLRTGFDENEIRTLLRRLL